VIRRAGGPIDDGRGAKALPFIVELVGPAGAGKSTLSRALSERDRTIRVGLGLWGLPRPLLTRTAIRLMPSLIGACCTPSLVSGRTLTQVVRLSSLYRLLAREARTDHGMVLLDEGPVFALSWFFVFHREAIASGSLSRWWHEAIEQWAMALNAVVLLDAPDPILARRIRARAKPHLAKSQTDREIATFLASFRAAFDHVLAGLTARSTTKLIAFDTDQQTPDQTAEKIWTTLDAERSAC
jgi:shikimate kinase